jgi:hypothetical protein
MDFIEHWFGISPDGGDGSLEALWLAAVGVFAAAMAYRRRIIRFLAGRRGPTERSISLELTHGCKSSSPVHWIDERD